MKGLLVVLAVLCLAMSAFAEEVVGPNDVAEAVAAPVETNLAEGVIVVDLPYYKTVLTGALIFVV